MTIADLEERIDLLSLIERDYKTKRVGTNTARLTPCPICDSKTCFNINVSENYYSLMGANCRGTGGKAYKYLMEVKGMNEETAYQKLLSLAGEEKSPTTSQPTKAKEVIEPIANYTNTILELYNKQTDKDKEYFINRGLSLEVIDRYKLCIGETKKLNPKFYDTRAIIPIWKNGEVISYNARSLQDDPEIKYLKAPGEATPFNVDYIHTLPPNETLILTEGEFDSLSLETIGVKSIAIGGVGNYKKFMDNLERKDISILTAFDNGVDFEKLGIKERIEIPLKYKDINDWIIDNKKEFKRNIYNQIQKFKRPDSLYNYLSNKYSKDVNSYKEFKDRKTGFKNLDDITSLYPGLYVIGGLSTLGKTTFIHQMTDQMAEQGEHILFFSLEMATLELVTKSLARLTVHDNKGVNLSNGVSSLDIRLNNLPGNKAEAVGKAINDYEHISKRFNIIEGNFNTNINTIRNYARQYIRDNKVKPIIVVDYLQIIPGDENSFNNKDKVDQVVTGLKQLSRDENITIIVVSSLNRSNYLTPIDFESFKESGGIEYTADVVWGLQLQAIHEEIFNGTQKIKEKREVINEAKKSNPRKIELVCLKNRNGISNYSCNFTYYPKYDLFISEDKTEDYNITISNNARRV